MQVLSEEDDDAFLDAGQLTEERIESVDYQYYYCKPCGFRKIIRVETWFSEYSECPNCNDKTLRETSTTLVEPTERAPGKRKVLHKCMHCKYKHRFKEEIPKLESWSSDSGDYGGGGGGDFGGGSSGGGGAGSSW